MLEVMSCGLFARPPRPPRPPPPRPLLPLPLLTLTLLSPLSLPPSPPPPALLRTNLPLSSRTNRGIRPDGAMLDIERARVMSTFTNERGEWSISTLRAQVVLVREDRASEVNDRRTSRTRFRRCPTHPATRRGHGEPHPSRVACSRNVRPTFDRGPETNASELFAFSTRHALGGSTATSPPPTVASNADGAHDEVGGKITSTGGGGASRRELPPPRKRGEQRPAALLAAMISALAIGSLWYCARCFVRAEGRRSRRVFEEVFYYWYIRSLLTVQYS